MLSYIPYLRKPPTHTETGSAPVSASPSTVVVNDDGAHSAPQIARTTSVTDPYGPRRWKSTLVQLSGKERQLNEFSVEREDEDVENNLVMLHGYGAGLGFFYRNFEGLSRANGWKLYALDLLGMGRSSRPPFRIHAKDREGKITEAENWFIDALEEWRVKRKLEKFTLMGHSLGGYLAVAYALKYPGRLNKLVLASPVGIPEDPWAVNAAMPEPGDSTLANEFTQDQQATMSGVSDPALSASSVAPFPSDTNNSSNPPIRPSAKNPDKPPAPRKPLPKWLTFLWDANISPFTVVRWAGPFGPRVVSGWTSRRFSDLPQREAQALHDYSYSLFRQRGSGEYALTYILAPGAFARSPLIRRIQGVGRQMINPEVEPQVNADVTDSAVVNGPSQQSVADSQPRWENGIPVVLMYGDRDWMDVAGGYAAQEKINQERERLLEGKSEAERKKDNGGAKVVIIRNAGHHVYLDGAEQFVSAISCTR